jgi:modified peptide precursor CbpA
VLVPGSLTRAVPHGELVRTRIGKSGFVQGKEVIPVKTTNNSSKRTIIATRKGCEANGTGLSHYVMMDPKK